MKNIRLVALDMDGTLLNDNREVPERNRLAIEKALSQGVHVVLSTGRAVSRCYPIAKELGCHSYMVTTNGAEIWTMEKELLDQTLLATETVAKLYNIATQIGVGMWFIATDAVFQDEFPKDYQSYNWLKFGCYSADKKKLEILVEKFSEYDDVELTNSLPTNVEVNAKGVSKAKALKKLCERIGITMDQVMACGDSLNDLKMIQEAGIGIAVGNAQEAIKNVADYTVENNNDAGVGIAIERFVIK